MLVRINCKLGSSRLEVEDGCTGAELKDKLHGKYHVEPSSQSLFLSADMSGSPLLDDVPLSEQGVSRGTMIFMNFEGEGKAVATKSSGRALILPDSVQVGGGGGGSGSGSQPGDSGGQVRPRPSGPAGGTMSIEEMNALREGRKIRLRLQPYIARKCAHLAMDKQLRLNFLLYLSQFGYKQPRMAYLFGVESEFEGVEVHFHYEPPQHVDDLLGSVEEEGAHVEREFQVVEKIASFLGMKCVGFMFSQRDVRDPGSPFSAAEVYRMATLQKRFGEKFVSVCCPVLEVNGRFAMRCEAWQVSDQCVQLIDDITPDESGDFFLSKNPEKKFEYSTEWRNHEITTEDELHTRADPTLFLIPLPFVQGRGIMEINFPVENRPSVPQDPAHVKEYMEKFSCYPLLKILSDFHFILYLADHLSEPKLRDICNAIGKKDSQYLDDVGADIAGIANVLAEVTGEESPEFAPTEYVRREHSSPFQFGLPGSPASPNDRPFSTSSEQRFDQEVVANLADELASLGVGGIRRPPPPSHRESSPPPAPVPAPAPARAPPAPAPPAPAPPAPVPAPTLPQQLPRHEQPSRPSSEGAPKPGGFSMTAEEAQATLEALGDHLDGIPEDELTQLLELASSAQLAFSELETKSKSPVQRPADSLSSVPRLNPRRSDLAPRSPPRDPSPPPASPEWGKIPESATEAQELIEELLREGRDVSSQYMELLLACARGGDQDQDSRVEEDVPLRRSSSFHDDGPVVDYSDYLIDEDEDDGIPAELLAAEHSENPDRRPRPRPSQERRLPPSLPSPSSSHSWKSFPTRDSRFPPPSTGTGGRYNSSTGTGTGTGTGGRYNSSTGTGTGGRYNSSTGTGTCGRFNSSSTGTGGRFNSSTGTGTPSSNPRQTLSRDSTRIPITRNSRTEERSARGVPPSGAAGGLGRPPPAAHQGLDYPFRSSNVSSSRGRGAARNSSDGSSTRNSAAKRGKSARYSSYTRY